MNKRYQTPTVDQACELLSINGLPTADLTSELLEDFLGLESEDRLIAMGGMEYHGSQGLLRSVVTADSCRGQGLAKDVVLALEQVAKTRDVEEVYLITIDADAYFERQGYRVIPRPDVPPSIRATPQFSQLCPDTAVVMVKSL